MSPVGTSRYLLNSFMWCWLHHFSEQPVAMLDTPLRGKKKSPIYTSLDVTWGCFFFSCHFFGGCWIWSSLLGLEKMVLSTVSVSGTFSVQPLVLSGLPFLLFLNWKWGCKCYMKCISANASLKFIELEEFGYHNEVGMQSTTQGANFKNNL